MNNSYFLIQTKDFNLQGVFAGNTYNTHVFVNLTIYMYHSYLDEYMYTYYIYIYTYIHLTSSPWTPVSNPKPPHKKNHRKKTSLKNLIPRPHDIDIDIDRTGRTSWRCTKNCWNALKLKARFSAGRPRSSSREKLGTLWDKS